MGLCERCQTNQAKHIITQHSDPVEFCDDCFKKELQPQAGAKRLGNFLTRMISNAENSLGERLLKA